MKGADAAKYLDEDVLSKIGSVGWIADSAGQKTIDGLVIARNEPGECFLRTDTQFGDKSCLFCVKRERTGEISQTDVRLQVRTLHINAIDGRLASGSDLPDSLASAIGLLRTGSSTTMDTGSTQKCSRQTAIGVRSRYSPLIFLNRKDDPFPFFDTSPGSFDFRQRNGLNRQSEMTACCQ